MAITRLKRKGRRNKTVARVRVETIDRLNAQPIIKNVDIEEIKKSFKSKSTSKKEVTIAKQASVVVSEGEE